MYQRSPSVPPCRIPSRVHALLAAVLASIALVLAAPARADLCCPSDFAGDGQTNGSDLGVLLGAWGLPGPTDLNGDGATDGVDLGLLLAAWGPCPSSPCDRTIVSGKVRSADGTPVAGAVVVTDRGGSGASGPDGSFSFLLQVQPPVESLQVTAVATIGGQTLTATAGVAPQFGGTTNVGWMTLGVPGCVGGYGFLPTFGSSEDLGGTSSSSPVTVWDAVVFDDGSGPALYVGGSFGTAGGASTGGLARWDGRRWSAVGNWFEAAGDSGQVVYDLQVFDDGTGPALYASGNFIASIGGQWAWGIARWNGSSWARLGEGLRLNTSGPVVMCMAAFDDGSGPALYVGGRFTTAGGSPAINVARWRGGAWSAVGTGLGTSSAGLRALTVFDDGAGPALYAGGAFTASGTASVNRVARWSGSAWSAVGGGIGDGEVRALTVHDDGSGPGLFVAGTFSSAGGLAGTGRLARWSGPSWASVGGGMNGSINRMLSFDDGSGPALYAVGFFTDAGGTPASKVARWRGGAWSALGSGLGDDPSVNAAIGLAAFDEDGTGPLGPALFVVGDFATAGGTAAPDVARWRDGAWSAVRGGGPAGSDVVIYAMAEFDDGTGPALYVAGFSDFLGSNSSKWAGGIWRWRNGAWSTVGTVTGGLVNSLHVFDDGTGPALYVGGLFSSAGGVPASNIARWRAGTWSALGAGVVGAVRDMATFDDGTGPALYVGGSMASAGGVPGGGVARWRAGAWSGLGPSINSVRALAVFDDDGAGPVPPALYVGGEFVTAGGQRGIVKWGRPSVNEPAQWLVAGGGFCSNFNCQAGSVNDLVVFDDGSGPTLFATGDFYRTEGLYGTDAYGVARLGWVTESNGLRYPKWSSVGNGFGDLGIEGRALAVFNDGTGSALYAVNDFTQLLKWAGGSANWQVVLDYASSFNGNDYADLYSLAVFSHGGRDALCFGGRFDLSVAGDSHVGMWRCSDP